MLLTVDCSGDPSAVSLVTIAESSLKSSATLVLSAASLGTIGSSLSLGWAGDSFGISGISSETLSMGAALIVLASSPDVSDAVGVVVSSAAVGPVSSARAGATGTIPVASTSAIMHLKDRTSKRSTIFIAAPIEK